MPIEFDYKQDYYYRQGYKSGYEKGVHIGARVISLDHKGNSPFSIAKELSIEVEKVNRIIDKFNS